MLERAADGELVNARPGRTGARTPGRPLVAKHRTVLHLGISEARRANGVPREGAGDQRLRVAERIGGRGRHGEPALIGECGKRQRLVDGHGQRLFRVDMLAGQNASRETSKWLPGW